jgi:hypothetical protein
VAVVFAVAVNAHKTFLSFRTAYLRVQLTKENTLKKARNFKKNNPFIKF